MDDIRISEIKQRAWGDLSGRWGQAVWVTLLVFLITLGAAFVPLGSLLIGGPLAIGYVFYFLALIKKQDVAPGLIFRPFNKYGNALLTYFLRAIVVLLSAVPLIIYIAVYLVAHADTLDTLGPGHAWGFILTVLVLSVLVIYVSLRLMLMYFIVSDNMEVPADKALELSWKMMSGYVWKLFVLGLSFILWYILGIITLGISYLWMMPYLTASVGHFYLELKRRHPEFAEIIDNYGRTDSPAEPMNEMYVNG